MPKHFLGIGKTLFNSSACLIESAIDGVDFEHVLNERVSRVKANGSWPKKPITEFKERLGTLPLAIAENRDVHLASKVEEVLNQGFPFFEMLKREKLDQFSTHFNTDIEVLPHHYTHATAALAMSPFKKSIIVVRDGAGSKYCDFENIWSEQFLAPTAGSNEECTIFLQDGAKLTEVHKTWQTFEQSSNHLSHHFSEGLGTLYEKAAEFIFNSKRAAGKVMGLATFGTPLIICSIAKYLEDLDWSKAYIGRSKEDWESSPHMELYQNIAATVQSHFEEVMHQLVSGLSSQYPEYRNIILTGGCALNCSANAQLVERNYFDQVYVPPFPGDECIALGCASHLLFVSDHNKWRPIPANKQHGYFGPRSSIPVDLSIEAIFDDYNIFKADDIAEHTAELLAQGKVIAWYQGRSESGPRALGNRSILAAVEREGLKDYLNLHIKFRESFRPYGCSCTHESASEYFVIPHNFDNPYMSFAIPIKKEFAKRFKEVAHIDGTSRMQTVRSEQNKLFHRLIQNVGTKTGIHCVLNTSLNVMGDPIVESISDARDFLDKSNVDGLAIGSYFVSKK